MRRIPAAMAVLLLVSMAGCASPSLEDCEKACLHQSKLFVDEKWAEKAKGKSDAERAQLEAEKAREWEDIRTNPQRGLQACIGACQRPLRQGRVDCILKAKTFSEAKACDE